MRRPASIVLFVLLLFALVLVQGQGDRTPTQPKEPKGRRFPLNVHDHIATTTRKTEVYIYRSHNRLESYAFTLPKSLTKLVNIFKKVIRCRSFFYPPYKVPIANLIRDYNWLNSARKYEKMERQRRKIAGNTFQSHLISRVTEIQVIATLAGIGVEEVSAGALRLEGPVRWI